MPSGLQVLRVQGKPEGNHLLLFHGYGATGDDLLSLSPLDPDSTWYFPEAPLKISTGFSEGRAWFPIRLNVIEKIFQKEASVSEAFPSDFSSIRGVILQLIEELHIPPSQLILGGFSQGAVLALETALYLPQPPKALLLLASTFINETLWRQRITSLKGVHFFQSHGTEDPILPYAEAHRLSLFLQEAGLKGKLHSFPGGHTLPPSTLDQLKTFLSHI